MKQKLTKLQATRTADSLEKQVNNLIDLFNEASPELINEGLTWYGRGHEICLYWSKKYKRPIEQIAGIIAALSPATNWIQNILDSQRLITTLYYKHNLKECTVTTYGPNKRKAVEIWQGNMNADQVYKALLGCSTDINKTSSFYKNLVEPGNNSFVTIDRHAFRVNLACKELPDICLTEKRYKIMKRAYIVAGKKLGYRGLELQAITWLTFRQKYVDEISVKPSLNLDRYVYSKVLFDRSQSVYADCPF